MKLSVFVFFGAMTLGFSSVAQADLYVQWLSAHKKLDCFSTCQTNRVTNFPMPTGYEKGVKKPTYFICTGKVKGDGWRAGFNRWGENTCSIVGLDHKEYLATKYYCLCTNNPPKPFR